LGRGAIVFFLEGVIKGSFAIEAYVEIDTFYAGCIGFGQQSLGFDEAVIIHKLIKVLSRFLIDHLG
jgi:uncharacterized membrane protein